MRQITLTIPGAITEGEARLFLAMKLIEDGKLSLGQAAIMAGYSKRAFMEILGKHGVPVFDYPPDDLEKDFQNA